MNPNVQGKEPAPKNNIELKNGDEGDVEKWKSERL